MLSLGAINKITGKYVNPLKANKKDKYICPDCNKELILCQGNKIVHHFRHKVDNINPCNRYSKPTESQIHKDAKLLLKSLLETQIKILFNRNCCCCKKDEEYEIPEMEETSFIYLEHRFEYNGLKIADVAYIDNDELLCIFEICNTHKTCGENRPEPWFEIDAKTLITMANDNSLTTFKIPCIRYEKCNDCYVKSLKFTDIEKYIRIKLGQNFVDPEYEYDNKPIHKRISLGASRCGGEGCPHVEKCRGNCFGGKKGYSCNDCLYSDNKHICDIFNNDYDLGSYRIVLYPWKGDVTSYIIRKEDYNKHDYWNNQYWDDGFEECLKLPYRWVIRYSGGEAKSGTVEILKHIIIKTHFL